MAAYNGAEWLGEQLASIQQQQGVCVQLWISVDRCTDDTVELCARYASEHPNTKVLPFGGPFGCAARNFFYLISQVDLAQVDFVALADQDDIWHSDKLARAVAHLSQTGDAGYSSNVMAFWPDGRRLVLEKSQPQVKYDYLFEAGGPGCTYVLPTATAQPLQDHVREVFKPLWDVNFHDWFIYSWVRSRGLRWYIDPEPSMEYRQHPSNQLGANTSVKSLRKRWADIGSGLWFTQVQLISRLTAAPHTPAFYRYLSFSRRYLLYLALRAPACRRRRRDQLLFALVCLISAISFR